MVRKMTGKNRIGNVKGVDLMNETKNEAENMKLMDAMMFSMELMEFHSEKMQVADLIKFEKMFNENYFDEELFQCCAAYCTRGG